MKNIHIIVLITIITIILCIGLTLFTNNHITMEHVKNRSITPTSEPVTSVENSSVNNQANDTHCCNTIGAISSFKELPPTWGAIILKVLNNTESIRAKPGSIIKFLVEITYKAKSYAPKQAELVLSINTCRAIEFLNIPKTEIDFNLIKSYPYVKLYTNVSDRELMDPANPLFYTIFSWNVYRDIIPVFDLKDKNYVQLRINDLVWYNTTYLRLNANESKTIEMYILIPPFIKPGFTFTGSNVFGTVNICAQNSNIAIFPAATPKIEIIK